MPDGKVSAGGEPASPNCMQVIAAATARLISVPEGHRIAALAFEGWDTHANEGGATGRLANLLSGLDRFFAAFARGMITFWANTAILVVTEFRHTARVNGTFGTDHGVSTAPHLVGGAVRGGRVIADWPGLKEAQFYEQRDLRPTTDVRAVCKGVVVNLFGASGAVAVQCIFPGTHSVAPIKGLIG